MTVLSVVVPAKDQAAHLADCLSSLVGQLPTGQLEVVVVDDGSTDATGDIAASYADRLPGLQIHRNEAPIGLASARNQGLSAAHGRYLAFLDGDDWLAPGHLSTMVTAISGLGVDFVRTDHVQCTRGQRVLVRAPEARRNRSLDPRSSILPASASTMVDYCYAWAGVFDRRLGDLLRFPEGLFTAEDRAWAWRLHLHARSYAVVSGYGILYRRGVPSSLTQIHDRRQLDFLAAFPHVFDLVRDDCVAELWWPKAARMFLGVLAHHLGRRRQMTARDRRDLLQGAGEVLDQIPEDVLADCYLSSRPERRATLRPLLRRRVRSGAA